MSKYTAAERRLVKSIVATLTLKRISDSEIKKEIERQTNKTLSKSGLYYVRQSIKKDSYHWYKTLIPRLFLTTERSLIALLV